jgi:DNA mismatch repair protein MutL
MGKIHTLSPELVSKIAAGEIIERPASVVKELIENALDAGSRDIKVDVLAGGRKLIRVTDDGEGMNPDDARIAFQRHTTSKIRNDDDLLAIQTFGFRGEALYSIAAVSRMKIITRSDGQQAGTEMIIEGGNLLQTNEIGCPAGTCIEVNDLFFNIPARLKFLKTPGTELGHISEVLMRVALANPQTQFQLIQEGKLIAHYPLKKDFSSRLNEGFGREIMEKMHFFHSQNRKIQAEGYATEPGWNRPNARGIYLFVNQRPVRDRLLNHAVMEAYRNLIPNNRYPTVLLFLKIPPSMVDVNVHPSKWEVRFGDSDTIFRLVVQSIREMLEKSPGLKKPDIQMQEIREHSGHYETGQDTSPLSFSFAEVLKRANEFDTVQSMLPYPFLGQVGKTYLLFESQEGLILIDQHAAHERILLENLLKEFSSGIIRKQSLLLPETLDLSVREAEAVQQHLGELKSLGFDLDPAGLKSFWVKSVPEILSMRGPVLVLKEMIDGISSWGKETDLQRFFDPLLRMMACKGAIQASQPMNAAEAIALFENLQKCNTPSHCPHGRPTILQITLSDLAKMFERK